MIVSPRYFEFRGEFIKAMDQDFYTPEYLDNLVATGKAECWFSDHASIIADIKDYPGGAKVIHGLVAAGPLDEILDLIAEAEIWGKSVGCTHAMIESREAWAKVLKSHGYEVHQVTVRKAL